MILLFSCFLKKEKERKYWVHPILKYREDGEGAAGLSRAIQSLLQDVSVSVWCFASDTRATYEKEDHQFLWTQCARIYIQCFVLWDEVDELDNRHSGFWRSLLRWLWTVKTPLKMLATDVKNAKNRTQSKKNFDGRKFRRQCANVIDITWGRIYFSTCENSDEKFGLSVQWP